jgi:hypothetical protein
MTPSNPGRVDSPLAVCLDRRRTSVTLPPRALFRPPAFPDSLRALDESLTLRSVAI